MFNGVFALSSSGFFAPFVPFFVKLRSNSGKYFWVSCLSGDEMHLNLYAEPVVSQIFGDFFEIGVLKNLTAYIQKKASVWESLFNKVAGLQDTFKTRKRSFISAFSICMPVPLRNIRISILCYKYFNQYFWLIAARMKSTFLWSQKSSHFF